MAKLCIVYPCCKAKNGTGQIEIQSVFLAQEDSLRHSKYLAKGRTIILPKCINSNAEPITALWLYSGHMYPMQTRRLITQKIETNSVDFLIISAGYGVVHATEPIRTYEKELDRLTLRHWREYKVGELIADYISQRESETVVGFFSGTSLYSEIFRAAARHISTHRSQDVKICYYTVVEGGGTTTTPLLLTTTLQQLLLHTEDPQKFLEHHREQKVGSAKVKLIELAPVGLRSSGQLNPTSHHDDQVIKPNELRELSKPPSSGGPASTKRGINASRILEKLVGRTVTTLTGRNNRILQVQGSQVVVATDKSPGGRRIPIVWVQNALDRLTFQGEVDIGVESLGYRSTFVTAVLLAIPGVTLLPNRQAIRLDDDTHFLDVDMYKTDVEDSIASLEHGTRRQRCTAEEVEEALHALDYRPHRVQASEWPDDLRGIDLPGLYSWWANEEGAEELTGGLGLNVQPGRIYVGQAGATLWPKGKTTDATLEDRIGQMHLGGTQCVEFSTLRCTLAAILLQPLKLQITGPMELSPESETKLSEWMRAHLEVAIHSFAERDPLADLEKNVNDRLDPPLNRKGMRPTPIREKLFELRQRIRQGS